VHEHSAAGFFSLAFAIRAAPRARIRAGLRAIRPARPRMALRALRVGAHMPSHKTHAWQAARQCAESAPPASAPRARERQAGQGRLVRARRRQCGDMTTAPHVRAYVRAVPRDVPPRRRAAQAPRQASCHDDGLPARRPRPPLQEEAGAAAHGARGPRPTPLCGRLPEPATARRASKRSRGTAPPRARPGRLAALGARPPRRGDGPDAPRGRRGRCGLLARHGLRSAARQRRLRLLVVRRGEALPRTPGGTRRRGPPAQRQSPAPARALGQWRDRGRP
jgi:hypothetical protein